MRHLPTWLLSLSLVVTSAPALADDNAGPRLFFSDSELAMVRDADSLPTMFAESLAGAQAKIDPLLDNPPDVPVPRDAGGGYTHEQHKSNGIVIRDASVLYRLTKEKAYFDLARDILIRYAELYPTLGEHPEKKEQSPGQLFWQSLNEAMWLVNVIQGYDLLQADLSRKDRKKIETGLFRPMVKFMSDDAPETFDRVHNHGTWAVASIGMTGYVLDEPEWVEKALYGLSKDGSAGFLKQMDELFSPDGYYSEGPYYQRFALMPFVLFADAIERNEPERRIFEHRDGILLKAIDTTVQLSYADRFFPINDAIKDKGINTIELCYGVAIVFGLTGNEGLATIAREQGRVVLTGDGFRLAKAVDELEPVDYGFSSRLLSDGPAGDQGGLGILRSDSGAGHQAVVFKSTAQGMNHGHFDKLNLLFYDNGHEIVFDYGAARFLNVESKNGGHYLPENNLWAKQTIAHNTLVVDGRSHYDGELEKAELSHPEILAFHTSDAVDFISARVDDAYPDVPFTRSTALLKGDVFPHAVVADVVRAEGSGDHQFDLPLWFKGQLTNVSHELQASTVTMNVLGEENGYQYLWLRATSSVDAGELFRITWLLDNRFYSYTVKADRPLEVLFVETGANDPEFNLVREQGLVFRARGDSVTFSSLLEPHGVYDSANEFTLDSYSRVESFSHERHEATDLLTITTTKGGEVMVALASDPDPETTHRLNANGRILNWTGAYGAWQKSGSTP